MAVTGKGYGYGEYSIDAKSSHYRVILSPNHPLAQVLRLPSVNAEAKAETFGKRLENN